MVMYVFKKDDCVLKRGLGTIQVYDSDKQIVEIKLGNNTVIKGKCIQQRYDQIDDTKNVVFLAQYLKDSRKLPEIITIHNDDITADEFKAMYIKISLLQSKVE